MVTRHARRLVVTCPKELAHAEDVIGSSQDPLTVEANSDSGVLFEIEEFRCLAAAARVAGTDVTFASDDPLRRELARIVGLHVEEPEPVASGVRRAIASNAATRKLEQVAPQPVLPPMLEPVPSLTEALDQYTNHGSDESWASFAFVVNPPAERRPGRDSNEWYYDGNPYPAHARGRRSTASKRIGKAAAVATVAALAMLIASAGVMAALIAPQATVTLVPSTSLINADVTYGVAGQSSNVDVTLEPVEVSSSVSFSATVPTTGSRLEPDGTASGELLLSNPLTSELFLPARSTFTTADGTAFTTLADVTVPAADPFGSAAMGSARTQIQATTAGPDSNIPAQALSGQLESGLFYSNPADTWGGSMREIATVSEADLEALRAQAGRELTAQHQAEVAAIVPDGTELVDGSITAGDLNVAFSHEAGADATEVSVESSQTVAALVYNPDDLQRLATEELNRRLSDAIPRENVLLADSITTTEPVELQNAAGEREFRMSASAHTRSVLDSDVLAALKNDIVGASEEEATGKVALLKGVAGFDIDYGPDWLPFNWPPRLESRIAINIDDSAATEAAAGTTRP